MYTDVYINSNSNCKLVALGIFKAFGELENPRARGNIKRATHNTKVIYERVIK